MTEVLLPTWIIPEEETHEWLDEGSSVFPAAFAPGIAQRQSYGGLRLKMSRRHTVRAEEKAQLLSILNATRGRYNVLRTKVHFALRGAGFGTELASNNTFANGTTGWTAGADASISVQDRVLRVLRAANSAAGAAYAQAPSVTTAQYAPYVWRILVSAVRGTVNAGVSSGGNSISISGNDTSASPGYRKTTFLATATSGVTVFADNVGALASMAGEYYDVPWTSLSRPALADNGTNLLLQSDEFDTTWAAVRSSVDDQAAGTADPIGTNVADSLIEDSSNNTHYVQQSITASSAVAPYSFGVALKAGTRGWAQLLLQENTSGTVTSAYFNLATGAVGTTATGANWGSLRTFSVNLGNGWFACYIVAQKTNAATSLTAQVILATADGSNSYLGNGTGNIYAWRATLAQSSVPTRLVQTTTTASTGTSQTGNTLPVKGLPASTSGLLLPGDYFEINGEIKQATAALNSDAAGLGYLQFEPALVRSPADNDPVIVIDPMGKFLVSNIKVQNQFGTQAVVTYDLEHIYE
jgi:hypothetical protein